MSIFASRVKRENIVLPIPHSWIACLGRKQVFSLVSAYNKSKGLSPTSFLSARELIPSFYTQFKVYRQNIPAPAVYKPSGIEEFFIPLSLYTKTSSI